MTEANEAVVVRFYEELCNRWKVELVDEILAEDIEFRASLGSTVKGRNDFRRYLGTVRSAFPDWHHQIDEMLALEDRVIARLTYSGTHTGPLGDLAPTGARVEYVGRGSFILRMV